MFKPLDKAYGFFIRRGGPEGRPWIVINSRHPLYLQRYTAAHEYGHYLLGHEASMDSEREIFDRGVALQEIAAQTFAADFLMPLAVVNRALDRLALPQGPHSWTAAEVYQFSLELSVSYRAMLTQLSALRLIATATLDELRKVRPSEIKKSLNGGLPPANSRVDVWLVEQRTQRRRLRLQVDDELNIRVPAVGCDGGWTSELVGSDDALQLITDDRDEQAPRLPGIGASARDCRLRWRAQQVGNGSLHIRSATLSATPVGPETFEVEVEVEVEVIERGNGDGQHVLQRRRALEQATREYRSAVQRQSLGHEPTPTGDTQNTD